MGKIGKDFCRNFLQPINVDAAGGLRRNHVLDGMRLLILSGLAVVICPQRIYVQKSFGDHCVHNVARQTLKERSVMVRRMTQVVSEIDRGGMVVAASAFICSVAVSLPGMPLTPEPTGRMVGASYCQVVGKCALSRASSMFHVFRGTVDRNQAERQEENGFRFSAKEVQLRIRCFMVSQCR